MKSYLQSNESQNYEALQKQKQRCFRSHQINKQVLVERPNIDWNHISGLQNTKKAFVQNIIIPLKFPDLKLFFDKLLVYGPPGAGKTMMIKACASKCNATLFSFSLSDLAYFSVQEIRDMFENIKNNTPAIVMIDQMDWLDDSIRNNQDIRRTIDQFLLIIRTTIFPQTIIIGCTNRPWRIDRFLQRRFYKRLFVPLPNMEERLQILIKLLEKQQISLRDQVLEILALGTNSFCYGQIYDFINTIAQNYHGNKDCSQEQFIQKFIDKFNENLNKPQLQQILEFYRENETDNN